MCPVADDIEVAAGVEAYMLNYFRVFKTLQKARDELKQKAEDEMLPESEQARAVAAYLDMSDKIAQLKSAHDRILARYAGGIQPPSADLVQKSLALSQALAEKIMQATTAVAVLDVATRVADAWTALLRSGPPDAAMAPALLDAGAVLRAERAVRATKMEFLDIGRG